MRHGIARLRWAGCQLLAFLSLVVSTGCFAYQRPPELTPDERQLLAGAPLPYAVTVAWWDSTHRGTQNPDAYASPLARLVAESGAFRSSRYERSSAPGPAELVGTSTGIHCNSSVIPLWTILTLGIVPTIFDEENCAGMVLRGSRTTAPGAPVEVNVRYKGRAVMGWLALLAAARPGWALGSPGGDERYRDRFALEVLRRRAEIERLLGP